MVVFWVERKPVVLNGLRERWRRYTFNCTSMTSRSIGWLLCNAYSIHLAEIRGAHFCGELWTDSWKGRNRDSGFDEWPAWFIGTWGILVGRKCDRWFESGREGELEWFRGCFVSLFIERYWTSTMEWLLSDHCWSFQADMKNCKNSDENFIRETKMNCTWFIFISNNRSFAGKIKTRFIS